MNTKSLMTDNDWKQVLLGELLLLSAISKVLYTYPEIEWLQPFVEEKVFETSPLQKYRNEVREGFALIRSYLRKHGPDLTNGQISELQTDFTRLFIGGNEVLAPPWESVYFNENRMIFQEQTLQVRQWYRQFGLESEKKNQEPDDHLALEVSFLAGLARRALQAYEDGNQQHVKQLIEAKLQFMAEHPLRWVETWNELVNENARTDFYRGVGLLTEGGLFTVYDLLQDGDVEGADR